MNLKHLLSAAFIVSVSAASAQDANRTFAITGSGNKDFNWTNIRQVNIKTGLIEKSLYESKESNATTDAFVKSVPQPVMGYGVAAAAYDKKHNRIYFTQMHFAQLSYYDLDAKEGASPFNFKGDLLPRNNGMALSEESHITRMVIAKDGYGYAITNDANHLIRFTTGKKTVIEDLGNIIDAEGAGNISIHNKCSSWGGDMIADAYNKLYVISANHNVFEVDVNSRIATYKGAISGLPANYTTNGAAVDADGKVVVSSANSFTGYYKFDIADLKATLIEGSDKVYNASDLANANLLFQKEADNKNKFDMTGSTIAPGGCVVGDAHIFPNPVTANEFKVSFDDMKPGVYTIAVTELSGKMIQSSKVNITVKGQTEAVKLSGKLAKGMYLVKVMDVTKQATFTERIVVQ